MPEIVPVKQQLEVTKGKLFSSQFTESIKNALPRVGVTPERFAQLVYNEVRKAPKLAEDPVSLMGAAMHCAQIGLQPGPMGYCWLIPYKNRRTGRNEATFQLGYKGLVQLLYRSEKIKDIRCQPVFAEDEFEMDLGADQPFKHVVRAKDRNPDRVVGVYCNIRTVYGGNVPEFWFSEQIEEHRRRFSKKSDGPWETDWIAMAKKTVAIQAAKYAPTSSEVQSAISLDERTSLGIAPEPHEEIEINPPHPHGNGDEPEDEVPGWEPGDAA